MSTVTTITEEETCNFSVSTTPESDYDEQKIILVINSLSITGSPADRSDFILPKFETLINKNVTVTHIVSRPPLSASDIIHIIGCFLAWAGISVACFSVIIMGQYYGIFAVACIVWTLATLVIYGEIYDICAPGYTEYIYPKITYTAKQDDQQMLNCPNYNALVAFNNKARLPRAHELYTALCAVIKILDMIEVLFPEYKPIIQKALRYSPDALQPEEDDFKYTPPPPPLSMIDHLILLLEAEDYNTFASREAIKLFQQHSRSFAYLLRHFETQSFPHNHYHDGIIQENVLLILSWDQQALAKLPLLGKGDDKLNKYHLETHLMGIAGANEEFLTPP